MIGLLASIGWAAAERIDLNLADVETLDTLPGLGPAKAQALVAWRAAHGPCSRVADLLAVPGIGAATVAMIEGRAFCGPGATATATATAAAGAPAPAPVSPPAVREPPSARPDPVDVNRATVAELMTLPGVFEARAEAIVAERERGGPYASCADLVRVSGIGRATVAALAGICTAGR